MKLSMCWIPIVGKHLHRITVCFYMKIGECRWTEYSITLISNACHSPSRLKALSETTRRVRKRVTLYFGRLLYNMSLKLFRAIINQDIVSKCLNSTQKFVLIWYWKIYHWSRILPRSPLYEIFLIRLWFEVSGFTYIVTPHFSTVDPSVIFTETGVTTRTYGPEAFSCQVPHTVIQTS